MLDGLHHQLLDPALFAEFTSGTNRLRSEGRAALEAAGAELVHIDREMQKLVQALLDETLPAKAIRERRHGLDERKAALEHCLAQAEKPPPALHPSLVVIYREG